MLKKHNSQPWHKNHFQGGIYHKDTGVVEFLGRLPHQDQVLADWDAQSLFSDGQNLVVLFWLPFQNWMHALAL